MKPASVTEELTTHAFRGAVLTQKRHSDIHGLRKNFSSLNCGVLNAMAIFQPISWPILSGNDGTGKVTSECSTAFLKMQSQCDVDLVAV